MYLWNINPISLISAVRNNKLHKQLFKHISTIDRASCINIFNIPHSIGHPSPIHSSLFFLFLFSFYYARGSLWFTAVFHVVSSTRSIVLKESLKGAIPFPVYQLFREKEWSFFYLHRALGMVSTYWNFYRRKSEGPGLWRKKIPSSVHTGQILCVHKTCSYNIDLPFIFPFCRLREYRYYSFETWSYLFLLLCISAWKRYFFSFYASATGNLLSDKSRM